VLSAAFQQFFCNQATKLDLFMKDLLFRPPNHSDRGFSSVSVKIPLKNASRDTRARFASGQAKNCEAIQKALFTGRNEVPKQLKNL